jgi:outer membrane immunogenic protein
MVGSRFQVLGLVLIGSLVVLSPSAKAGGRSQFGWSGFYVGGNAGYAWGDADFSINPTGNWLTLPDPTFPTQRASIEATTNGTLEPEGFAGGVQVGYNEQRGTWLLGIEADIDGIDADASRTGGHIATTGIDTFSQRAELSWMATLRGRLGFVMGRSLIYATGGVAFADWEVDMYMAGGPNPDEAFFSNSSVRTGGVVGGGFEYALDNHWSLKGEYLYADFGSVSGTSEFSKTGVGFTQEHDVDLTAQVARGGINYRF